MPREKREEKYNKTRSLQMYFLESEEDALKKHPNRKENERFTTFIKRMISEKTGIYIS